MVAVVALAATLVVVLGRDQRTPEHPAVAATSSAPASSAAALAALAGPSAGASSAPAEHETSLDVANGIAARFHLEVTSGYRSPAHNAAVGGVPGSYHTRGTVSNPGAVDLSGTRTAMQRARAWVVRHVPNLAEAMVHAVCLVDEERPWRVTDGGLHLHLAFASSARASRHVDLSAGHGDRGCPTRVDRFETALRAIEEQRGDGKLTAIRAARFTIRASTRALADRSGPLRVGDRRSIVAARRTAQATIGRALAARRREQHRERAAYDRYLARLDDIAEREASGVLALDQAAALRGAVIASALAGRYGSLTDGQRQLVLADRATLAGARNPEPTATTPVTATTPTTTSPSATPAPPAATP